MLCPFPVALALLFGLALCFGYAACLFIQRLTARNMPQPNQHLPSVPNDILRPLIESYHRLGIGNKRMCALIKDDVAAEENGWTLIPKTIQRRREAWNLLSVRQQNWTLDSIGEKIEPIRVRYPKVGAKRMRDLLREQGVHVSLKMVQIYNRIHHHHEVIERRRRRLQRRRFWATGVNDINAIDQHDKLVRFGLCLHVCLCPFSGFLKWLKVWWTNSNPRLIFSYYLEAARTDGGIPLVTQSDPGSENNCIASGHTTLRHMLDPTLAGTLQHRWMNGHANIKPEIFWSQLRREFSPGFEGLFDKGVLEGWYDKDNVLENYIFRWIAIPFLQRELDIFRRMRNASKPRADKNKILPIDRPELIYYHPNRYNYEDYKVHVSEADLQHVESLYAPPDHPVFQLVPPSFHQHADRLYKALGSPAITFDSFWFIYNDLLADFHTLNAQLELEQEWALHHAHELTLAREYVDVIPGVPMREGGQVIGEVNGEEEDYEDDGFTDELIPEAEEGLLRPFMTDISE